MNQSLNPEYKALLDNVLEGVRQFPGASDEILNMSNYLRNQCSSTDSSYIGNLIFPELYPPARLPTRFALPTAAFVNKTHFYVDPNSTGNFGLIIFPKAIGGNLPKAATTTTPAVAATGYAMQYISNAWQDSNWGAVDESTVVRDDIKNYYDHVRLNGCVVKITYMGSLEQMSGVLVCSIDYGYIAGQNNVDVVEDGYYVQRNRTGEGVRAIWVPRDQRDQDFMDTTTGGDFSQAIMIYGASLPTEGSAKFRVDIERHFEGIPNQTIRDYVELRKATYSNKTLDILGQLHEKMPQLMTIKPNQVHEMHEIAKNKLGVMDMVIGQYGEHGVTNDFSPYSDQALALDSMKKMFYSI